MNRRPSGGPEKNKIWEGKLGSGGQWIMEKKEEDGLREREEGGKGKKKIGKERAGVKRQGEGQKNVPRTHGMFRRE